MPLPTGNSYTLTYIYDFPDGQRAELIDGKVYHMAPPSRKHQGMVGELFNRISNHINPKGGACKPYVAPFAVFLNADDYTYVEPDISVICAPAKLTEKGCSGAPDWIIEIVSPGSRRMDCMIKLFKYRSAGVREYWVVDPDKNRITVYDFAGEDSAEYSFSDTVSSVIYPDLSIDFGQISL
ncbi:MAG: Uma2 family endonuclease, partial [Lachnospiraceae bacterium]|nr:Uma2 family endonuclease [Lachnospiraceae bacterium]